MDDNVNELQDYIYGAATAPTKQQYNYTISYFKQQRRYKQITFIYLTLLSCGLLYSFWEIFFMFSPLMIDLNFVVQLIDNAVFLIVCYESIFKLTWPNKNYLVYLLIGNAIIVLVRFLQDGNHISTLRGIYLSVLIITMILINYLISKLQETALLLRPDENDPQSRFTV